MELDIDFVSVADNNTPSEKDNEEKISEEIKDQSIVEKKAFILMWKVIEAVELQEGWAVWKTFEDMVNRKLTKMVPKGITVLSLSELRQICCQEYNRDPTLAFTFAQRFLSTLLKKLGSGVAADLGDILERLGATMENVALTDVLYLIHVHDMKVDNDDLIDMMTKWLNLLVRINKCGTRLHKFVTSRLKQYTLENGDNQKPWIDLQDRMEQWEVNLSMERITFF